MKKHKSRASRRCIIYGQNRKESQIRCIKRLEVALFSGASFKTQCFVDYVLRAYNMPPLSQKFILMGFPFYKTLLYCLEVEKCVRIDFTL